VDGILIESASNSGFSCVIIPLLIEDIVKKIVHLLNNMNFHPNFAIVGQKVNICFLVHLSSSN
jgi:hypothetical protein